jgi:hypothetical protein
MFHPVLIEVLAFQIARCFDAVAHDVQANILGCALEFLLHKQDIVHVILNQQKIARLPYHPGFRSIVSTVLRPKPL